MFKILKFAQKTKPPEMQEDERNIENEHEEPIKKFEKHLKQFKIICKKFITFLFSRIGLFFLVVLYLILGGLLFRFIESENEMKQKTELGEKIKNFDLSVDTLVDEIWQMTTSEIIFKKTDYNKRLKKKIQIYKNNFIEVLRTGEYKIDNFDTDHIKWTIPGSILYAATLITTIGYGHISCYTKIGKVVTIIYAMIGMPLMALCLSNIGKSEANLCRFLYLKVCCGYCNYVKKRNVKRKALIAVGSNFLHDDSISVISKKLALNENNHKTSIKTSSKQENFLMKFNQPNYQQNSKNDTNPKKNKKISHFKKANNDLELYEVTDYTKVRVPLKVTIFILATYIVSGGLMFMSIEEWTLLDGIYFCFITLSTIGLGDIVPGNSITDTNTQSKAKIVAVCLYLLIGLSLLLMALNLMQEEIVYKTRMLCIRIGIMNAKDKYTDRPI